MLKNIKIDKWLISISLGLSIILLFSFYGFSWFLASDDLILMGFKNLPENQKWKINGIFSMNLADAYGPMDFDFFSELYYSPKNELLSSSTRLGKEGEDRDTMLALAHDETKWMFYLPFFSEEDVWYINNTDDFFLQGEDIIDKVRSLKWDKAVYKIIKKPYGGDTALLCVRASDGEIIKDVAKLLEQVPDIDGFSEELETSLKDDLLENMDVDLVFYISPEMKIEEIKIEVFAKEGGSALKLSLVPEKGEVPDFSEYKDKNMLEIDNETLESLNNYMGDMEGLLVTE